MKNKLILSGAMVSVALLLSSCHIYQKYQLPEGNKIIDDYKAAIEAPADSAAFGNLGWEEVFTDPQLQSLIRTALANNKDLDNARLNVEIAHAQLKGARLGYLPSLSFNPNGGSASYGGSRMNWSYTLPLAASWEIDVFGKILNRKRGAEVSYQQAQDYRQAVRSQIIAGVAHTYYSIVLLQKQLSLTTSTAEIWKEQVSSMELMKEAGRVNEAAVAQSRANYHSILASIPDIENGIHQAQNTLSLLLNTYPQVWAVGENMDIDIPAALYEGIPVNYVAGRPDVRAAEKSFAAAYYATNSARANFYPSLVISAQGGFTNMLGSIITNPGKWFIQLAGQLTAPIFMRGQNIATLEAAKASQQIALNDFQYAVINASAEVSDALVELDKNSEKRAYLIKEVEDLENSVNATQELLTFGQATYLEVLTARSSLLNAQLASLNAWYGKVNAIINLYQALGGGR